MPRYFNLRFLILVDYKEKNFMVEVIHEHEITLGIIHS